MSLKRLEIIGKYEVNGRVLLLPITGNGDVNITLGNCLTEGTESGHAWRELREALNGL
jgi:hypothetical protein